MSLINETRRVVGTGAFLNCHRQRASDNPNYPPKLAPDQAKIIDAARRFRRAQVRRLQGFTVQISVRALGQPRWKRLQRFTLSADELDDLLDTAARLERRATNKILHSWAALLGGEVYPSP